jgi:hypothetical protein
MLYFEAALFFFALAVPFVFFLKCAARDTKRKA